MVIKTGGSSKIRRIFHSSTTTGDDAYIDEDGRLWETKRYYDQDVLTGSQVKIGKIIDGRVYW